MKLIIVGFIAICVSSTLSEALKLPGKGFLSATTTKVQADATTVQPEDDDEDSGRWGLGIGSAISSSLTGAVASAGNLASGIQNAASSAIDGTKNVAGSVAQGVKGVASSAIDGTKNVAGSIAQGVKGAASSAVNAAQSVAGSAIDLAIKATESAINTGVDVFLKTYKALVKTLNIDEMPLPPILISPFYVASFNARNGFFKSLSSLSKDGDISIKRNGTTISLLVPLRFDDMRVGYNNYSVSLAGIGTEGRITIGIKSNKVRLGLSISLSTKCALSLDEISLANLEDIDVDMTGVCYYCGIVTSKVSTIMANYVQSTIKSVIQDKLSSIMNTVLSENSLICAKFLGS